MIKINLLPREKRQIERIKSRNIKELYVIVLSFLFLGSLISLIHFDQKGKIKDVKSEIDSTQNEINKLRKIEKKVKEFKEKNKYLETRIKVIADLETMSSAPLFILDSLSQSIPERAWINEITLRGNSSTIRGIAWNEPIVAQFLKSLEKSDYFNNVQVSFINKEVINNVTLRSFEIRSDLKWDYSEL